MRRVFHWDPLLWIVASSVCLWGCGGPADELPRHAVSGKVTFKGAPLAKGLIQFQPADGGPTAGGAAVDDGSYSIAKSEGLVPGKYQVSVTSTPPPAPLPPGTMPGDPVPPPKETIPAKYNVKTTLSASVTQEGPNTFDFVLEGK